MAYKDLQDYLQTLDACRELHRVRVIVDPVLEITELADRMVKTGGPALLFENVKGSIYPVAVNLFGTLERTCRALGVTTLDEIAARITALIPSVAPSSLADKLKLLLRLKDIAGLQPKSIRSAPVQQIIEQPADLTTLPVLQCWPKDGGKFITLPLVITKHPDTGIQNIGMYRIQILNSLTAIIHWHIHHDGAAHHRAYREHGRPMDIAVALGCDPATIYAATAPLPSGIDELLFAGFLRGTPVETVPAVTVDLQVPAHAEFVIEGRVHCTETRREGPFGDHTGFYSLEDEYPLFEITAITRKKSPVYPATIVGKPLMEDYFLGKATERIFLPFIKMQLPEIVDINFPAAGVFHNCVLVSIKKAYPGHARKVASALWGMGQMMLTKTIIIVEDTVDVQNLAETAWVAFSNVDPERDIFTVKGPLDVLDHSSPTPLYGSKVGIDATRKWPEEGHPRQWPDLVTMDDAIIRRVTQRWKEYGFS
ncbi:MAG: menaquinone biosynthesis decarboxylase [Desulfobacterota bacterium]|nr:menaquinone biosynthesis decarboxylase [Thermodesulfobacteriota bacterium]